MADNTLKQYDELIARSRTAGTTRSSVANRNPTVSKSGGEDLAYLTASLAPISGEIISGKEAVEDFEKGNYGMGLLGAFGAVPLLGYGPRAVKGLIKGTQGLTGNVLAGQKNYIPNWYGNDRPDVPPTFVEEKLGKAATKVMGVPDATPSQVAAAGKKATGFAGWVAEAPLNMLDAVFNPRSRALFEDTGINAKTQETVKGILKQIDENPEQTSRLLDKATGQVIYNLHIGEQAGRKAPKAEVMSELSKYSFIGDAYTPVSEEAFKKGARLTKTMRGKRELKISDADLSTAFNAFKNNFNLGDTAKLVFKQPTGKSGNHLGDMAAKNPANKFIRQAAKKLQDAKVKATPAAWNEELVKRSKGGENYRVIQQDADGGVWIRSGTPVEPFRGSAVVEGGVAGVTKVYPDGRSINFMFDQHDFLEKIPAVGKVLEKMLPNDVVAVAGPLHLNLLDNGWAKGIKTTAKIKPSLVKDPSRQNQREVKGMLESLVRLEPTPETLTKQKKIIKERAGAAGGAGLLTGAVVGRESAKEEEE